MTSTMLERFCYASQQSAGFLTNHHSNTSQTYTTIADNNLNCTILSRIELLANKVVVECFTEISDILEVFIKGQ